MKRLFFILIIIIMLVMISKYNIQNEHKIIEVSQEGFAISLKSAHAQYASYKDVDIKATIRYINDDSITYRVSKPFYFMIVSDIKGNIVDRLEPIDVAIDYTFEKNDTITVDFKDQIKELKKGTYFICFFIDLGKEYSNDNKIIKTGSIKIRIRR